MSPFRPLRPALAASLLAALLLCGLFWMHPASAAPLPDTMTMPGGPDVSTLAIAPEAQPAPDAVLHLSFALKSSRLSGADAFVASQHDPRSLNYHHPLTPEQFGERFGASDADVAAVTAWAQAKGMNIHVWPNKLFVSAQSTVGGAEAAFGVRIIGYRRAAGDKFAAQAPSFYAPDHAPALPTDVASRVQAVFGLDNFLIARPAYQLGGGANKVINAMVPRATAKTSPVPAAPVTSSRNSSGALPIHPPTPGGTTPAFSSEMTPDQVSTFYEFDPLHSAGFHGEGQTIAIYSPSGYSTGDLSYFATAYGRTGYTLNVINIDGGNTDLSGQLEPALDTDVIIGQAQNVTINMYELPNNSNAGIDAFNQIASDNPPVITSSWSYDEHYLHTNGFDSVVSSLHSIFVQIASQGISMFNDTGDGGATVGTDGTNVAYPASDPDVTAVGGTDNLVDSSSSYVSEQGWTGSGGGRSVYFSEPGYQAGPGVSNSYSNGMRQIPDVSADGGPSPGYSVRAGGNWYHAWGTSASTPLWATATVLINQGASSLFGGNIRSYNLNPFLYDLGTNLNGYNNAEVFHDSTSGSNGYPTTGQWDFVTGWGSARFAKLYDDDVYQPNYTPYNPYGGWIAPILISTSNTSAVEPTYFNNLTTYYFGYALQNTGPADGRNETSRLTIDGTNYDLYNGDLPVTYYFGRTNVYSGTLALGPHTLVTTDDVNNNVAENNESDNSYTRTITVRPYNDPFVMPFFIYDFSGTSSGTNSYASVESGEPNHGGRPSSASVWWYWTCPGTRTYTFNTEGSNYDTTLGVYTGSEVDALTTVAENDDVSFSDRTSSVVFFATAGTAYRVAVDGYSGATGNIALNWGTAAPTNDNFVNAKGISGATGSLTDSNLSATKESGEPDHGGRAGGASVWYAWTAPSSGPWTFRTEGSNFDTLLGVYTGSEVDALTTVAENDDVSDADRTSTVTFQATSGTTYYIAVDGYNGAAGIIALSWSPITVSSLSVSPTSVVGGPATSSGTVTLSGAAPSTGLAVTLKSSNTAAATAAATLNIPAGATSAKFKITTYAVTSNKTVTITASAYGTSETATLTVTPPPSTAALSSFSLSPTSVSAGQPSIGQCMLVDAAPSGGVVIALKSSDTSSATVQANTVTVDAGDKTKSFTVTTYPVTSTKTVTITATVGSSTKTATLTITPASMPITVSALSVSPTSVMGGPATSSGTVTLSGAAPSGGVAVTLKSSNTAAATAAATLNIPAGATSAKFKITTYAVTSTKTVTITASAGGVSKTATLTVTPPPSTAALSSFSLSPTSVPAGQPSIAMFTLVDAAPSGGVTVTAKSSDTSLATVQASTVTVDAGDKTKSFTVTTYPVTSTKTVTITVAVGSSTKTATLTITPGVSVKSLSVSPTSVVGGPATSSGTVTLSGAAPSGGVAVTLKSSNTAAATAAATLNIPAGATSAKFKITTYAVTSTKTVTITASAGGVSKTATLTVTH